MESRSFDFAVLGLGVMAVSTAAVLIREAEAPALVIAGYRLTLASAPFLLLAAVRRQPLISGRVSFLLTLLAGVFLAVHFGFWVASVQQTSIVTSVALVASQPLFVTLLSGPLLREWPSPSIWLGVGLATAGGALMVVDHLDESSGSLTGDLYALLGALFASAYILTGRAVRTRGAGWSGYVTLAYSVGALLMLLAVGVGGEGIFGYSGRTYVFLALLALVPQVIGHTALNRSLGYLPAVTIAIAILGEPVGATLLAALFLDEVPTVAELLGGALLLTGVYAGIRASMQTRREAGGVAAAGDG